MGVLESLPDVDTVDPRPPRRAGVRPGRTTRDLVAKYARARRADGLEERTLQQLRYRLYDFADQVPENPDQIHRRHVERWNERPELSPQYRRSRLSALRGFASWMYAHGYIRKDFTISIKLPRVADGIPKRLQPHEVQALIDWSRSDKRTLLIVLLMLQEGLRRIEVSRLNVEDIGFAEQSMMVRGKGGQGQRTAALPISDETWRVLTAYLAEEGHRNGPLIRNRVRHHGRCAPNTISELVRQAMVEAGVKQHGDPSKTPHSLRHTAAQDILTKTDNVRAVQRALRHASVRSTEVYLRGHVGPDLREIMAGRSYMSQLDELREAGVLTAEEHEAAKARLAPEAGDDA